MTLLLARSIQSGKHGQSAERNRLLSEALEVSQFQVVDHDAAPRRRSSIRPNRILTILVAWVPIDMLSTNRVSSISALSPLTTSPLRFRSCLVRSTPTVAQRHRQTLEERLVYRTSPAREPESARLAETLPYRR